MFERNYFEKLAARFARILTRRAPFLYMTLGKLYHNHIFRSEALRLRRKNIDIIHVRYNKNTLKRIRNMGFHSQFGQDFFVTEKGLVPKEGGLFLDIGCSHPIQSSNSYYFEKVCGYKGVAIDPLAIFEYEWSRERPNSIFINAFVSISNKDVDFAEISGNEGWEHALSGAADKVELGGKNVSSKIKKLKSSTLQSILDRIDFQFDVDILSVDVEGHEIEVMSSVDWSEKKPKVIIIENTGSWKKQEKLRSFIVEKGYKFFARVWIVDDVFVRS